jgi:hypothetical protein
MYGKQANYYLCLWEAECGGDLVPLGPGEVLALPKLFLQLQQLLRREGGTRSSVLTQQRVLELCTMENKSSYIVLSISAGSVICDGYLTIQVRYTWYWSADSLQENMWTDPGTILITQAPNRNHGHNWQPSFALSCTEHCTGANP